MKDRIKVNSSFTAYENKEPDTTQEGLESELIYKFSNQKISFLTDFLKVEQTVMGQIQDDQIYHMA